jgi:hypothetical protein
VRRATQRPLSLACPYRERAAAGWKTIPSWYLVSNQDNAIPPEAEVFMAERMAVTTEHVDGSHTAFIGQPSVPAALIAKAAAG